MSSDQFIRAECMWVSARVNVSRGKCMIIVGCQSGFYLILHSLSLMCINLLIFTAVHLCQIVYLRILHLWKETNPSDIIERDYER